MKKTTLLTLIVALFMASCSSTPAATPTSSTNDVATALFQRVYIPLTQTALAIELAATPTPSVTPTPPPTETPDATQSAAGKSGKKPRRPYVTAFTGCWKGPGSQYTLISNISAKRYVDILGVGSVPGWYIIRNPYFHNPCWIEAIYLNISPQTDLTNLPVMTPGP